MTSTKETIRGSIVADGVQEELTRSTSNRVKYNEERCSALCLGAINKEAWLSATKLGHRIYAVPTT